MSSDIPLEWKCAGSEYIGGCGTGPGGSPSGCAAAKSACDREEIRLVEPAAVVLDSRSAGLAVYIGSWDPCVARRIVRQERAAAALVFAGVVVADCEDDFVASESDRARQN